MCPNSQDQWTGRLTNYAAIVDGDGSSLELCRPGGPPGPWPVVVEVPEATMEWTEPGDVSPSEIVDYPEPSDPGGFAVIWSDGKVRRLAREAILENWSRAKAALRAAKSPGG